MHSRTDVVVSTCPRCAKRERVVGRSYCQPCEQEYNRQRYEAQRERRAEQSRLRYAANRDAIAAKNATWRRDHPGVGQAWAEANREKTREYGRKYREKSREVLRDRKYTMRYGITIEQYDGLFAQQGGRCAICACLSYDDKRFHVDHNHRTGKIRGLLCRACNHGLGQFGDDPGRLRAAARYIERYQTKT